MAKRQLTPRAARALPPEEGWDLSEAFKEILGDDDYSAIRKADRAWNEAREILRTLKLIGEAQPEHYRAETDAANERERLRRKALASVVRVMRSGTYEAHGWRLEPDEKPPTSPKTVITVDHWNLFNAFDLDGQSLSLERPGQGDEPTSVAYAARFVRVHSGPKAAAPDGRGRPVEHRWLAALDVLLTKIVDPGKFSTSTDLANLLEECFDDIGAERPADTAGWIRRNLPNLNELAKAQRARSSRKPPAQRRK